MSRYGSWCVIDALPAFRYSADQDSIAEAEWDTCMVGKTRRHALGIGNRRLQAYIDNQGGISVFDETYGLRWLTAPNPHGTGFSIVEERDGPRWSTDFANRVPGTVPTRTFGPTWFRIEAQSERVKLERTVLVPEGEIPWLLIRVRLTGLAPVRLRLIEEWAVRPRFLNVGVAQDSSIEQQAQTSAHAMRQVHYDCTTTPHGVRAREVRSSDLNEPTMRSLAESPPSPTIPTVFGEPLVLMLEALSGANCAPRHDGARHPVLSLDGEMDFEKGETRELWFRFGVEQGSCTDPEALYSSSLRGLLERLPTATSTALPMAAREVPWHAAILTGGACADAVLGGHTLDQATGYAFGLGLNGAARDPLQHALPLIYTEPDLALSVLRNTLAWGRPDGYLPWCIDGAKQARGGAAMPTYQAASDLTLWALWLAAEYAAATGDLDSFMLPAPFHPEHAFAPVSVFEHLRRNFNYLVNNIGLGPHGHLRVLDCDWADGHMGEIKRAGLTRTDVAARGESVLNSAMAAWVLPVWAGLCARLGDHQMADEARRFAEQLRLATAREWNGRWFHRGRCDDIIVGGDSLFLETQPWAILCGAATEQQSRTLLNTIDELLRAGSPLGARECWPVPAEEISSGRPGEALAGGVWFSLQMTLIWAAARFSPELAQDEWRRFTLTNHTNVYPDVWEGTLSGPDAYNAPASQRPGRTWAFSGFALQQFPINCLHAHAQPLLSYLRLLGVEPLADGSLRVAGGCGEFRSRTFQISADGSGSLSARGPVKLLTRDGLVTGSSGNVRWPARSR